MKRAKTFFAKILPLLLKYAKAAPLLIIAGFTLFTENIFSQDLITSPPDSLTPIKLYYVTLDSMQIKERTSLQNIFVSNVVCLDTSDGINVAYHTGNRNSWICFNIDKDKCTNDFSFIDLDHEGQPELIVKGEMLEYGTGGGTGIKWMMLINIDSIPTKLLDITYGCFEESFGDKQNNGNGAYVNSYERAISINKNIIHISALDPKQFPFECPLTNLPEGNYIMKNGTIVKSDRTPNRR